VSSSAAALPWWDALPEDFSRQRDGTPLDAEHPFKIRATAALDHVGRLYLGAMIATGVVPNLWSKRRAARERERFAFYERYAETLDRDQIFRAPPDDVAIDQRTLGWRDYHPPRGIDASILSFDSPYQPLNPDFASDWSRQRRNVRAQAEYWHHGRAPRKTLIFIHGFFADPYWLNSLMFSLPWFHRNGYDVVLFKLPFHGPRAGRLDPFSGYGFVSGGLASINESMLQSVHDLRIVIGELYRRGAPAVGVSGLSLGGYVSSMAACVEPRLAFCIPNSPVVVPIDMGLEWLTVRYALQGSMRRQGIGVRDLRRAMALHSPLSYAPRIEGKRVLIIGGAGDRFTPPRYVRLLHEYWPGSHLHWFPGNHIIHLQRGFYIRLMKDFMDDHCRDFAASTAGR
jgi:pimeloyl-ACP methyl ester carboxylesterase